MNIVIIMGIYVSFSQVDDAQIYTPISMTMND